MKKLVGALLVGVIVGAAAAKIVSVAFAATDFHVDITVNKNLGPAVPVTRVGSNLFDVPIAFPGAYQIRVICSFPGTIPRSGVPNELPGAGELPGPGEPRGAPYGAPGAGPMGPRGAPGQR